MTSTQQHPWQVIELRKWNPALHPRGPLGRFIRSDSGMGRAMGDLSNPDIGGFTYDPRQAKVLDIGERRGYAIAVPGTEVHLGSADMSREEFRTQFKSAIHRFRDHLGAGSFLGGWYSDDRDAFMLELTNIHDVSRSEAVRRGAADNQEGIFDVGEGEFIPTGGSGG